MQTDFKLLLGNEAIGRGAVEGGVSYCTGYPGNPSSEIIGSVSQFNEQNYIEVEWAVNEIVALEAAAAFAFAGLKALVTMKQNGISVAADFLTTVNLNELKGGLLLVVCDDPGPLTSTNELDSRHYAKMAQVPLLEPSTPQEAKDMTKWLLDFSQEIGVLCMLRSVSRLSHARGKVEFGPVEDNKVVPNFDINKPLINVPTLVPFKHEKLLNKMKEVQKVFEKCGFNSYQGPSDAQFVIITAGLCFLYAQEAVSILGLEQKVGILKIGTTWPLPETLIKEHLKHADKVLFVEEIDPFLEDHVKIIYAENNVELGSIKFYGKNSGDIYGVNGPGVGEINTGIVLDALSRIENIQQVENSGYQELAQNLASTMLSPRDPSFCPGCPHKASLWALKVALEIDGRNGFVVGDIGCYGMATGVTGYNQIKTFHCMGSGMGNILGFSRLRDFGFNQPAVALSGDSTFYHAGLPALVNAKFNQANALFVILDNGVTAMTGFQENPASSLASAGKERSPLPIEDTVRGLAINVSVIDPIENIKEAIEMVYAGLQEDGVKVIVFKRGCATFEKKVKGKKSISKGTVDETRCVGNNCGCDSFCTRVLGCSAIQFNAEKGKAVINEDFCTGCSLCVQMCPQGAISLAAMEVGE